MPDEWSGGFVQKAVLSYNLICFCVSPPAQNHLPTPLRRITAACHQSAGGSVPGGDCARGVPLPFHSSWGMTIWQKTPPPLGVKEFAMDPFQWPNGPMPNGLMHIMEYSFILRVICHNILINCDQI